MKQKNTLLFYLIFVSVCFGCKTQKKEQIVANEIAMIDFKITNKQYKIFIHDIIPNDGLVYKPNNNYYYINVDENILEYNIPGFRYDLKDSVSNPDIYQKTSHFEYTLNKQQDNVYTIRIESKLNKLEYDFSILITKFGDATIYVKQGIYNNISMLGSLKSINKKKGIK